MICGHCGEPEAVDPCAACGESPLLDGRYRLEAVVGRGAAGITYRAIRLADGRAVAVKEMQFHRIDAEKVRTLYTREAEVLRQLDHPAIPDYVDHFVAGTGKHRSLYLAQAFIDGRTLAAEARERRYREEEVLAIVVEVAQILIYLHDLRPPVIHRDIKPGNIMRRGDGTLVLVDFGAVRDALADPKLGGSTVVGTYGFMAPEQYRGDASPASDLYAVGITAAVLLARQSAETLSEVPGQFDWRAHLDVHPATAALLDDLIEADPARRLDDARRLVARAEAAIAAIARDRDAALRSPRREAERDPPPSDLELRPPDDGQSFAEPSPPVNGNRGLAGAVFGAGLLVVFAIVAFTMLVENSPGGSTAISEASLTTCGGQKCRAPQGLKGLDFGMTVAQARAALPAFTDESPASISVPVSMAVDHADPSAMMMAMMSSGQATLPGASYDVRTTLGALPATCQLEFAVNETLSRMTCTIERQPDLGRHVAAEQALFDALVGRYGPPRSEQRPPDQRIMGVKHELSATWSSPVAQADLNSAFQSFDIGAPLPPQSTITLDNVSSAHQQALAAAQEQARREIEQARRKKAAADRRAAEETRRAIEASQDKLTDDL